MRAKWVTVLNGRTSTTSSTGHSQDGKVQLSRLPSTKRWIFLFNFLLLVANKISLFYTFSKKRTHSFNVSGTTFNIHSKYKLIKPIGTGSYGVVISAQVNHVKPVYANKTRILCLLLPHFSLLCPRKECRRSISKSGGEKGPQSLRGWGS